MPVTMTSRLRSYLLLGDHVYQYDLHKRTFRIATEQEGQDIIGALLPITNHEDYTYLNDTKRIRPFPYPCIRSRSVCRAGTRRSSG